MTTPSSLPLIGIEDLRIGMFIHLDMRWMSHPFPLGSFKIANAEQIATIRALGLTRLRWNPAVSDVAPGVSGWGPREGGDGGSDEEPAAPVAGPAAEAPAAPAVESEHDMRRRLLTEQRVAQQRCERQFAEAARDCRLVTELVLQRPREAKAQAEQLSRALVDKMLVEQDVAVRLLTEAAGDKASAHAMNVTVISLLMGRVLGLDEPEMLDLGVGAMLHDIGKLELPDRVRHREEHFTGAEIRFYEEHVAHGVGLARRMGLSPGASLVIAQHHEHADGSGFPLRLNADRMTPASRIVALVNRYDNLCNPHVAAKAMTPHEALSLLFAQGRNKFDAALLNAFIRMMGVYPAGSAVQLTDDRFGLVVGVNATRPLKPRVLVFEPGQPFDDSLILDLETQADIGIRRSIKPQQLPDAVREVLLPRPRVAYFFEALTLGADRDHDQEGALAAAA